MYLYLSICHLSIYLPVYLFVYPYISSLSVCLTYKKPHTNKLPHKWTSTRQIFSSWSKMCVFKFNSITELLRIQSKVLFFTKHALVHHSCNMVFFLRICKIFHIRPQGPIRSDLHGLPKEFIVLFKLSKNSFWSQPFVILCGERVCWQ